MFGHECGIEMRKGAYILLIENPAQISLGVGRLGKIDLPAGTYAYVGSGLNGLDARIRRHFSHKKRVRWHIDYLLQYAAPTMAMILPSDTRLECFLNRLVSGLPDSSPMARGFGCSDCRCLTHLHLLGPQSIRMLEELFPPEMRIVP